MNKIISFIFLVFGSPIFADIPAYSRNDYAPPTIKYPLKTPSFYQGYTQGDTTCQTFHGDHVVALQDAHYSGAYKWSNDKKKAFAKDIENIVPACDKVNGVKGARLPKKFIKLAKDQKGIDVHWHSRQQCAYIFKYHYIKAKWDLSIANNDMQLLDTCK